MFEAMIATAATFD